MSKDTKKQPVIIRKYANRRLYNTEISSYVTLEDLCEMVKKDEDFVVQDSKSGEDLTRSILTQIIFEQEAKGESLLPEEFLKSIIGFYDDNLNKVVPVYLNKMMEAFAQNQHQMKKSMEDTDKSSPLSQFGDMYKSVWENQQEAFAKTMDMFTPYAATNKTEEEK